MSYLSMMEATLPPGFRFHPRDEELVCDYLSKKLHDACTPLIDVDLNKCEPWDLPDMACVGGKEWYFFNLRDRKYATGQRTNRATISGYWKATGKDRHVKRGEVLVGMRKTLVFYEGRAPKGRKTDWVMHEFRMEERSNDVSKHCAQEDWVLCRVFYKSRRGLSSSSSSSSKPIKMHGTVVSYEDNNTLSSTSSSSLPPLMETFITFNNYTVGCFEGYNHRQVPCFSNDPPTSLPTIKNHHDNNHFGGLININDAFSSGLDHLNQLDVDQKVMREVLDQLTKLEGGSPMGGPLPGHLVGGGGSLAIGRSGYLSGNAGISSSMW